MLFLEAALSVLLADLFTARVLLLPPAPGLPPAEAGPALSGPAEAPLDFAKACAGDVELRCPGAETDAKRRRCLGKDWSNLGPMCQKAMGTPPPSPCAADIKRLCGGVEPGPALGDCLDNNAAKLSDACREDRAEDRQHSPCYPFLALHDKAGAPWEERKRILLDRLDELPAGCFRSLQNNPNLQPCADDAKRLCGGTKGPERSRCLSSKMEQLSAPCRKLQTRFQKEFPCRVELASFCKDASESPVSRWLCLRKNLAKLSDACRERWKQNSSQFACHDFMQKHCKDIPPHQRRDCMLTNIGKASAECRESFLKGPQPSSKSPQPPSF